MNTTKLLSNSIISRNLRTQNAMKMIPTTTPPSHAASTEATKRVAALCHVIIKLCKMGKAKEKLYGKNSPENRANWSEIDKLSEQLGAAIDAMNHRPLPCRTSK